MGSYLVRYRFDFAPLNWAIPQWLGKISYSLYLTHWIVIRACGEWLPAWASIVSLPLAIVVGYLVWRTIETRSIALSHMAGQLVRQTKWKIA